MISVESAICGVNGVTGVAARHLENGKEFRHDADGLFFMASALKVPLLVELYRQADRGQIDLAQRVELADNLRVAGSGVLRHLGVGLQPSVADLAMLMIIVSDNVATDILYHLVGRDNLSKAMQELGLANTRIPLSTRELLFSLVGIDVDQSLESYERVSERVSRWQVAPDADALSEERSDVSSPNEMVRLLEMVYRGDVLSARSREAVLDVLKRQTLNSVIPYYLPTGTKVAHKTGGYHSVRCDVGLVYAPNGPYAVALMVKQITDHTDLDPSLARVSKAIYDEFAG